MREGVVGSDIVDFDGNKMKGIADYLDVKLITFLEVSSREEALKALVNLFDQNKKLISKEDFYKAILHREKIVSTGIGMGVAIPHAKMSTFKDFYIAIGIIKGKGLDWDSIDKAPVNIIFMIAGPENQQTEYLQVLSLLTMIIKNEKVRKQLILAPTGQDVIKILSKF